MFSIFDIFSVGIGPSSSHTVGPMRAAKRFTESLVQKQLLNQVVTIECELFGSLGSTGVGHGTGTAVILGLMGQLPETFDPDNTEPFIQQVEQEQQLRLADTHDIAFLPSKAITYHQHKTLPGHANAMQIKAKAQDDVVLLSEIYYSIGGGFILRDDELNQVQSQQPDQSLPYAFHSFEQLKHQCQQHQLNISELITKNEAYFAKEENVAHACHDIWQVMRKSVERGLKAQGELPGGLNIKRRAPALHLKLSLNQMSDPLDVMDWVNLFALAASEENAAGGRVVTAPTNGAAGVIPAVLCYFNKFISPIDEEKAQTFFATAAAIASLYKRNASISGAEVGCQGEVGVACSMAAGALTAMMGGNLAQIENAAEIGMEHHLGMTCDPVGGLVQIPCIERNAMGAIKAINASRMALKADYEPKVSLDKVIQTMMETGKDMQNKYKETSKGGLAIYITQC
ncbi:L-serine ammonia-lyase [Catenovulum sp. SM1970]|uniref:L-serine ammonia-lyase n=1 Tax=Marinifaba aquimaris TaxID=2741323 RepID=UPI001571FBD8|nr:L-serine ammonia-lyase [Marinifaba aquimaris]NTS77239.1 L-serine ammonia-lyase [Marinifaba aquimaris]